MAALDSPVPAAFILQGTRRSFQPCLVHVCCGAYKQCVPRFEAWVLVFHCKLGLGGVTASSEPCFAAALAVQLPSRKYELCALLSTIAFII